MPQVYHKYVGHDNNRDFVTLTQEDTRVIAALYSTEWYPQVMVEKHQMGSTGPRYYVPPNHDPIAQNVDEGLWTWSAVFGSNLSRDMAADGLQGVASHWTFDDYWPGSTETSIYKGVISFLTEAASCRRATPVFVEPTGASTCPIHGPAENGASRTSSRSSCHRWSRFSPPRRDTEPRFWSSATTSVGKRSRRGALKLPTTS